MMVITRYYDYHNNGWIYTAVDTTGQEWVRSVAGKWAAITARSATPEEIQQDFNTYFGNNSEATLSEISSDNDAAVVVAPPQIIHGQFDVDPLDETDVFGNTPSEPSLVLFSARNEDGSITSTGEDDGISPFSDADPNYSVSIVDGNGDGYKGKIASKNDIGFIVDWTKVGNGIPITVKYSAVLSVLVVLMGVFYLIDTQMSSALYSFTP